MNILLQFFEGLIYGLEKNRKVSMQLMSWKEKTKLIKYSWVTALPSLPTHIHYLNEEVDHVCVIALHRVHERTLTTFDVLIRKKAPWEKSGDAETVNVNFVMLWNSTGTDHSVDVSSCIKQHSGQTFMATQHSQMERAQTWEQGQSRTGALQWANTYKHIQYAQIQVNSYI